MTVAAFPQILERSRPPLGRKTSTYRRMAFRRFATVRNAIFLVIDDVARGSAAQKILKFAAAGCVDTGLVRI